EDADVITLAQASDRRRVLVASRDIELKALAEQGDGQDESALRAAVADIDIDEVAAEIERLNEEIERLNGELQLAAQAVAVAEKELEDLQRREGIGAAAQEANDAAAEMIAHVERWLRLKAANIILG